MNKFIIVCALFLLSCEKEEPKTFVDNISKDYDGRLRTLTCSFVQDEISSIASKATIAKISDNEVEVTISNSGSPDLVLTAKVNTDSTFVVSPFTYGSIDYIAGMSFNPKLRIGMSDCSSTIANLVFNEN